MSTFTNAKDILVQDLQGLSTDRAMESRDFDGGSSLLTNKRGIDNNKT